MRFLTRIRDADDVSALVRQERGARGSLLDFEREDHIASSSAAAAHTVVPVASRTEEQSASAAPTKPPRTADLSRTGAKQKKTRGDTTRKVSKWRRRRRKAQRHRDKGRTRDDEPQVAATAT